MPTSVKKRSVVVAGHSTSVSLEMAFWDALRDVAAIDRKTINQLVSDIDQGRSGNLSSAIRVYILNCARSGRLPAPAVAPRDWPSPPNHAQNSAA